MTFDELLTEVIQDTARPDMGLSANGGSDEIPRAIVSATMTMHQKDYFYRDIQPADLNFGAAAYILQLDTSGLPRYRSFAFLRKWDPSLNTYALNPALLPPLFLSGVDGYQYGASAATKLLKFITPDNIFDDYQMLKTDVCYQVGQTLMIRSSTPLAMAKIGWYAFPEVDYLRGRYVSWIAEKFPYAIIHHAVSRIFTAIGEQEKSRKYDGPTGLVAEQVEALMKSNVTAQGY